MGLLSLEWAHHGPEGPSELVESGVGSAGGARQKGKKWPTHEGFGAS